MPSSRRSFLVTVGTVAAAGCLGKPNETPANAEETPTTGTPRTDPVGTDQPTASDAPSQTDSATRTPRTPAPAEPPDVVAGAWTHPEFDAAATRHNPDAAGPEDVPGRAWSVSLEAEPLFPLVAAGRLLVGVNGSVRAFDVATGEAAWTQSFEGHPRPRAIENGTVFVVERTIENGEPREPTAVHALSLDGATRWSLSKPVVPQAVAEGVVYGFAGPDAGSLAALSAADGSEYWRVSTASLQSEGGSAEAAQRFESVAVGPERLFATFSNSGSVGVVFALDRGDGSVRWFDAAPNHGSFPTVAGGTVLSGGFYGYVEAWTADGTHRWEAETAPPVSGLAAANERVFKSGGSGTSKPQVSALSLESGAALWSRRIGRIAAVGDGVAYRVTGTTLSAVDSATGKDRWAVSLDGEIGTVRPVGAALVVTVVDGPPRVELLT